LKRRQKWIERQTEDIFSIFKFFQKIMADPFFPNTPMPGTTTNPQPTPAPMPVQPAIVRPAASAA